MLSGHRPARLQLGRSTQFDRTSRGLTVKAAAPSSSLLQRILPSLSITNNRRKKRWYRLGASKRYHLLIIHTAKRYKGDPAASYTSFGASPDFPKALAIRSFCSCRSSMASFRTMSLTFISRTMFPRSFSSSFMEI